MSGETRKLQKVGGGTYTVSIPKEWATEHSLSAGETVHLYPDGDGSLVVCSEDDAEVPARTELRIDASAADDSTPDGSPADSATDGSAADVSAPVDGADPLERTLRAAYAAGVERITLTAEEEFGDDRRRRIDRLVRDRTGTRVAAEAEESVAIETILDDAEVSVQRTVVRLQFVTLSLFRTAVDLALDPDANGRDRIDERRADAQRLCSLVTRQFNRSLSRPATAVDLGVDRPTAFDCYRTAQALDRFADHGLAIATASDGLEGAAATTDLRSIAETVRLHAEEATTAVVEGATVDEARALRSTREEIAGRVAEVDVTSDRERRILDLLVECADVGDRIADIALEAAIRREE